MDDSDSDASSMGSFVDAKYDDAVLLTNDDVSNYNTDNILPESPETIREIRTWLQPTDYDAPSGEYRRHLASRAQGTGAWLPESETYCRWLNSSEHGFLWIKGIPG